MTRNDIHKPSVIITADYTFIGLSVRAWEYGAYPDVVLNEKNLVAAHMVKTGGTFSDHNHGGSCHICGAHAIYLAVFYHSKTNTYIQTGMDCARKLGMQDDARFRVFQDILKAAQHHRAGKKKAQGLLVQANLGEVWELFAKYIAIPEEENGFVASIAADPADPFRRQIYADWLEEAGRADQATKVRAGYPVERVGLPVPAGPVSDIIYMVRGIIKYGELADWRADRLRKLLAQVTGAPAAPAPVKPTYPQYLEATVPGAWAVYQQYQGNQAAAPNYATRTIIDIVGKGVNYNSLTANQVNFVKKLLAELAGKPVTPAAAPVKVTNDMTAILTLFGNAAKHLKRPRVRLQLADGSPLLLALAGANSKYKGQVMVTDGGPYRESQWFGVIGLDGAWKPGKVESPAVLEMVKKFAADPVGVAVAYGKATSACCFCAKALTDERSVTVGYGPICADHFGLPWGDVQPDPTVKNMVYAAKLGDEAAALALHDYQEEHK